MAGSSMTFSLFGKDVSASRSIQGVGQTADKVSGRFAGTLGKGMRVAGLAMVGAATAAGAGIAVGLAKGFGDAAEFEQLQKQTRAVLKSTGNTAGTSVKGVQKLAASLENLSGIDETLIINSQNVLATFTQVRNETGKGNAIFDRATKAALNISAALGTDLQSASVQVGKALNDPIKGISALIRGGVSFTEAQKEQIKRLVEGGEKMKAQKLILGELGKEFGNAAEAAGKGFQGALARLQDTVGDTFRDIAMQLLPVATRFVDWIRVSAIPWLKNLAGWLKDKVVGAFRAISDWWNQSGRAMWESFSKFISGAFNVAVEQMKVLFVNHILPAFNTLRNEVLPPLVQGFNDLFGAIGVTGDEANRTADAADTMQAVFKSAGFLLDAQVVVWRVLGAAIRGVAWAITTTINTTKAIAEWVGAVKDKIGEAISLFVRLPDRITAAVAGFGTLLWQAGVDLIEGLIGGIGSKIREAVGTVVNLGSSIIDGFRGIIDSSSPSKVFAKLGVDITDGLMVGLRKGGPEAVTQVKMLGQQLVDKARSVLAQLRSDRSSLVESMVSGSGLSGMIGSGPDGALTSGDVVGGFAANASRLKAFAGAVAGLRRSGLRGDLIKQILGMGPDQGLQVAQALLAGGAGAVSSANASQASIAASAASIGAGQYGAAIADARGNLRAARRAQQQIININFNTPTDSVAAGREVMKVLRKYRRVSGDMAPA